MALTTARLTMQSGVCSTCRLFRQTNSAFLSPFWNRLATSAMSSSSSEKPLANRVALVTGSTSGIGLGIARGLASRGSSIILNGFGDDKLIASIKEEFVKNYGCSVNHVEADLSNRSEIADMCRRISELCPDGVDILVNNAGFQHVSPVEDFPMETWDAMLAVMLTAPFLFIKHIVPDMKRKGWGRIINIASAHGHVASANKSAYITCKHGIVGLTKTIALETAGMGVTSNALCPGYVNTPILQKQVASLAEKSDCSYEEAESKFLSNFHASGQAVKIEHLADAVLFLCSEAGSQMTGTSLIMDGGWTSK